MVRGWIFGQIDLRKLHDAGLIKRFVIVRCRVEESGTELSILRIWDIILHCLSIAHHWRLVVVLWLILPWGPWRRSLVNFRHWLVPLVHLLVVNHARVARRCHLLAAARITLTHTIRRLGSSQLHTRSRIASSGLKLSWQSLLKLLLSLVLLTGDSSRCRIIDLSRDSIVSLRAFVGRQTSFSLLETLIFHINLNSLTFTRWRDLMYRDHHCLSGDLLLLSGDLLSNGARVLSILKLQLGPALLIDTRDRLRVAAFEVVRHDAVVVVLVLLQVLVWVRTKVHWVHWIHGIWVALVRIQTSAHVNHWARAIRRHVVQVGFHWSRFLRLSDRPRVRQRVPLRLRLLLLIW